MKTLDKKNNEASSKKVDNKQSTIAQKSSKNEKAKLNNKNELREDDLASVSGGDGNFVSRYKY